MMTRTRRTCAIAACGVIVLLTAAQGQGLYPSAPSLGVSRAEGTAAAGQALPANSVSHLTVNGSEIWIGTGKGLARSGDGARSWESFAGVRQFARPSIFAIAARGDTIWSATGYSKEVQDQNVQTGSGYTYSLDNGATWNALPQPLDATNDSTVAYGTNLVRMLPILVPEQNVTFDAALAGNAVWIASWSSGIRRSTNLGATWQRTVLPSKGRNSIAPTDSLGYYYMDPRTDNNYLGFAVAVETDAIIWAGTAGGVNRSSDGGISWRKFTRQNQTNHILGDWVIAIGIQRRPVGNRIWTTNWPADGGEYGVSSSDDNGEHWNNHLHGVKAYDFAFRDSVVYVATDAGLYRSADNGRTWSKSGTIVNLVSGHRLLSPSFYAAGSLSDTVYGGTSEGLVKTIDNAANAFGNAWEVYRSMQPLPGSGTAYAYPNPFSPRQEVTRIHFTTGSAAAPVTIEIFDFGMNRVRTVVRNASRSGERDEIWDGMDDRGETAKNGVYFYRLQIGDGDPVWGKVMVIQ